MADRQPHLRKGDDPDLDGVMSQGRFHADRYRRAIRKQSELDGTIDWYRHQAETAQIKDALSEIERLAQRIAWEPMKLLAVLDAANRLQRHAGERKPTYAEIARELRLTADRDEQALTAATARVAYATADARRLTRERDASAAAAAYFNNGSLAHAA